MTSRKVVVYAGPTISRDEVLGVIPDAKVRPPVARGDLLREGWSRDDTAVIIDGYYRERLSVGHKEILWLLNEGVNVIGAASMGALRAAELSPYGMRGAGSVFRMYATGEVDGDDEVAVLHGPADRGYPAGTVAMVSIRHGCREGAAAGLIPAAIGALIVAAAKALPFTHRTWEELDRALGPEARDSLTTLERMIGSGEWDLKRLDALSALRAVGDRHNETAGDETGGNVTAGGEAGGDTTAGDVMAGGEVADTVTAGTVTAGEAAWAADVALTGITHYEALKWRSTREYAPGRWISDLDVLNAGRLFGHDYPQIHEEVLTGLLADFAAERGLGAEAYMRTTLGAGDRSALPRALTGWLTDPELAALPVAEQLRLVMVRVWPVWQSADWRPMVVERIRESGHWDEWSQIVARADEIAERTRGRLAVPPPEICGRIFLRHWHTSGAPAQVELARRGFAGTKDLGNTAKRFFALDVQNARGSKGR